MNSETCDNSVNVGRGQKRKFDVFGKLMSRTCSEDDEEFCKANSPEFDIDEDDEVETRAVQKFRGGVLTSRLRPCSVPCSNLMRCNIIRMEESNRHPDFIGIPGWLKPFLNLLSQRGCREDRLCSIFRNLTHLPHDLYSAIRDACTSVVVLTLHRMDQAQAMEPLPTESTDIPEAEPWLYETAGLADDELDTFDGADFGVLRCRARRQPPPAASAPGPAHRAARPSQVVRRPRDALRDGALRQPGLLPHGRPARRGAPGALRPPRPAAAHAPAGPPVPLRGQPPRPPPRRGGPPVLPLAGPPRLGPAPPLPPPQPLPPAHGPARPHSG